MSTDKIVLIRDGGPGGAGVTVSMNGFGRLERIFKQLDGPLQKKVMYKGIRAGLTSVRDSAENNISKHTGRTAAGIKIKMKSKSGWRGGMIEGRVAVTGKFAPLAHLIEWGRQSFEGNRPFRDSRGHFRSNTSGGGPISGLLYGNRKTTFGAIPPQHFMTRAWMTNRKRIPRDLIRGIARGIRQAVNGQRIR